MPTCEIADFRVARNPRFYLNEQPTSTKMNNNSDPSKNPVIISAARTPTGRLLGALSKFSARELGSTAIRAAIERSGLADLEAIDEVLMGNVVSAGLGQNIARQCAISAGLPQTVGATTINKVCGSSLKTVMLAAQAIRCGDGNLFVAGGVESMSNAPHLLHGRQGQFRYGNREAKDSIVVDGLWCPFEDWIMGEAAEFIAEEFGVTRQEMDEYALASHRKAIAAIEGGQFKDEIVPLTLTDRRGNSTVVDTDEPPRKDSSLESLSRLRPVFTKEGKVTAGNAPGLNDGAAAVVICSEAKAAEMNAAPLARIVGYAQGAMDPKYIFATPALAIERLLAKTGWSLSDVDLFEVNEAFAAQVLANGRALQEKGWNWEKVNINGGGIALGHPLGASGARILTTLLYTLKNRGKQRGIATLCLGGGEAVAVGVERMG